MLDYSFHQIITDPTEEVLEREVPQIVAKGIRSLKVFSDLQAAAPVGRGVHQGVGDGAAERLPGHRTLRELCRHQVAPPRALLKAGMTAPKYHAWSRPGIVEREATHRAIALAELVDQPIQVFHVSCAEAAEEIARAQHRGLKVWGETCPQYLTLTGADMDRPGFEGAAFMCSPSPAPPKITGGSGR
ncbi:hypothetical protein [Dankookia sp. P2]|uniref:hypothetical protein n=1 Tax=Dankookia sp. P2 TaxID=3423955 RepID=UPI003D677CE5